MKDLSGKISVQLDQESLLRFCSRHVPAFDRERFEVVAVRVFSAEEFVVTIYAADKESRQANLHDGKFPVRKFKVTDPPPLEVLELAGAFNFTVSDGDYELDQMEVVNR